MDDITLDIAFLSNDEIMAMDYGYVLIDAINDKLYIVS